MSEAKLPHAERIAALLREGKRAEAQRVHNAHVAAQLKAAANGPINLSDLMAGKEAFIIDDIERRQASDDVALTWEPSPEHSGLQGVLLSDRGEQGTLPL